MVCWLWSLAVFLARSFLRQNLISKLFVSWQIIEKDWSERILLSYWICHQEVRWGPDRIVDICEMKFCVNTYRMDKKADESIRNKIQVVMDTVRGRKAIHPVIVTTYGLAKNEYSSRIQRVITMDDLFCWCRYLVSLLLIYYQKVVKLPLFDNTYCYEDK